MASKLFNKPKLFLAIWPDKTFTIAHALSSRELFWKLDEEGDPSGVEIEEIKFKDNKIHIHCPWPDGTCVTGENLVFVDAIKNKSKISFK